MSLLIPAHLDRPGQRAVKWDISSTKARKKDKTGKLMGKQTIYMAQKSNK